MRAIGAPRAASIDRVFAQALSLLAPPLCGVCREPCAASDPICRRCARALTGRAPIRVPVAGIDAALAACAYDGTARRLVSSLKFGPRLPLAHAAAEAIAGAAGDLLTADLAIVPVPAAPARARRRGFDSAAEIAFALAALTGLDRRPCLVRSSGPRQVGRRREERLADPPRVTLRETPPERALLLDDVITTGATLVACAGALRAGGCLHIDAVAFAHST